MCVASFLPKPTRVLSCHKGDSRTIVQQFGEAKGGARGAPRTEGEGEDLANEVFWFTNEDREADGKFALKGTGDQTGGKIENSIERRQRECREALDAYNASTDHPSADDVVSGKVGIEEALKKGFEAKFGGQRVIFFTQQKIGDKYQGRGEGNRLQLIRHALNVRGNMFPVDHEGGQIGVVERWTQANSNHRFVITADKETGVAVNVMRCSNAYIKSNYKK